MKFVAISDTHNKLDQIQVPNGDVLLHAGDATFQGNDDEIKKFNHDMMKLPHKYKIFVPGNHDWGFEIEPDEARKLLDPSIIILNGTGIEIEGKKIWGSPIQPVFFDWAFNRNDQFRLEYWRRIPEDTDVLITHCPPFGKLDQVHREGTLVVENTGCRYLADNVESRVKPKFHIFGHIHEGYGFQKDENVTYINASNVNHRYQVTNKPIIFNLD